jgi:nucleoside-diphosphate-sugar epimerase
VLTTRVVFGAGYTGSRVAELATARGEKVIATVRSEERARGLAGKGFQVTCEPVLAVAERVVDESAHAIVCFPPDGETDAKLAPLLARARAVSYISTTGVYGDTEGTIDDQTPVSPEPTPHQARILQAEEAYRAVRATVLRAPGIYGPDRGLHVRVRTGAHRLPGDAAGWSSRIHVDDLATLLLASDAVRGETFVVGDLEPARQRDVVAWICEEYACAYPPTVPPEQVHETLRRNRRVDPTRALRVLGVELRYPSFRSGMKRAA